MLSIKDIVDKTAVQRKNIRETMDSWGQYHPDTQTPEHTTCSLTDGLKPADAHAVNEAIRNIPLKEFLAKSGTTGIAGATYLVPTKIHDDLIIYSKKTDIVPDISGYMVNGWNGGDLKVDIVYDDSYVPKEFSSGGQLPTETVQTAQATLAPISFGLSPRITGDLIDDNQFGLVEFHLQKAALAMGAKSSDLALTVLKTATDGVGTVNSGATGDADETRLVNGTTNDIVGCIRDVSNDRFLVNSMVVTPEAWGHSISTQASEVGWAIFQRPDGGLKLADIDVIKSTSPQLHDSADAAGAAMTACITILFDKNNALLTGRKRWMQINNYVDPVRDLAGATITARQDSVTLYDDSIYVLTET